jgi:hypothetical protein
MKVTRIAFFMSACLAAVSKADAQLFPDKKLSSVGRWTISTAQYGIGCVAHLFYGPQRDELSISGNRFGELTLLITVDPKKFSTKLNGSEEDVSHVEIALVNNRWNVEEYGYRGTSGVVLKLDGSFLQSFIGSKQIKVTEFGREKLSIKLGRSKEVIAKLRKCFSSQ